MFRYINRRVFIPTEQKETRPGTEQHGDTEPNVKCHEDQHEQITNEKLDHV